MRHFAVVYLVMVTGGFTKNMEREDPSPPPLVEGDDPLSEGADPGRVSWAGVYEGDMILTDEQARDLYDNSTERQAVKDSTLLWPNAVIPYQFESRHTSSDLDIVNKAFAVYAAKTCLRLVKRTNQRDYVAIIVDKNVASRCGQSPVGRQGGRQTLELNCLDETTVLHEVMHAVGFFHETCRYDRDTYVKIHYENIIGGTSNFNFKKFTSSQIQHLGEPYDYSSIMHYPAKALSKNGRVTIERLDGRTAALGNNRFSQVDVDKLNKLYRCSTTGCSDKYTACPSWANANCTRGPWINWMAENCKKSCNKCGSTCTDNDTRCPYWANTKKYCTTGPITAWMASNCKKSCNMSC